MRLHRIVVLALALTTAAPVLAQSPTGNRPDQQQRQQRHDEQPSGKGVLRLLPGDSVTEHTLQTPQGTLNYSTTAGIIPLYGQSGDEIAGIFHTAYVAKNPASPRPLSFAFNGG